MVELKRSSQYILTGRLAWRASVCILALFVFGRIATANDSEVFRAGASAVDITPEGYPVRVNGMFVERSADSAIDTLYARAVALDDGETKIILCIVDTCMMEQALIDTAKVAASAETGIPTERMMVSATHTHSAPSAMACLGSRQDPAYAAWLPDKIAEAIQGAVASLRPAQIGWTSIDDWAHTHNRRWIRRADKTFADPFGDMNVRAHMHPGYESVDVIGPSGPVDPELSILAAQALDGTPIALLANYSQHYYSSPLLSADYYGVFARQIALALGQDSSEGPFVAMMSQGTSGDLMWMDYGSPKKEGTFETYGESMATQAMSAYRTISWKDHVDLEMTEKVVNLAYRVPDAERLAWAQERVAALKGELPTNQSDIYAHEALYLHERQRTDLKLQAIRIGDLSIATLPDEVYAITGLKLKLQTPSSAHFNIELANGSVGYIPPPEQHDLGGYTTWPARTAGLEVQAEPIIVETLLAALEEITASPRKLIHEPDGPYTDAVKSAKPMAYWRLNEIAGRQMYSAIPDGPEGTLQGAVALFLPGVGSGTGWGAGEALRPSNFGGPDGLNRAIHFLPDGTLSASLPSDESLVTTTFWFWLGELSGASIRSGTLVTLPIGVSLNYDMDEGGSARLSLVTGTEATDRHQGTSELAGGRWHFASLTGTGTQIDLHVDGIEKPELSVTVENAQETDVIQFGGGLEGKLDEIALYGRALTPEERRLLWDSSRAAESWAAEDARRNQAEEEARARAELPVFPGDYAPQVAALNPVLHVNPTMPLRRIWAGSAVRPSPVGFAEVSSGRIRINDGLSGPAYSLSLWFKSTIPNDVRAVTAYLFSRGPDGDTSAPGDHLGIGGTHDGGFTGKLIMFNGNAANDVVVGKTPIPPHTWNHVVLVRDGNRVRVYLNGGETAEIDTELPATAPNVTAAFLGARSDHFAPLSGFLGDLAIFDRAISPDEATRLHTASGQPTGTPTVSPPAPQPQLSSPPLAPADGLASIQVPEGYTVDLVASEPQLLDPVAFDWDTHGRLWVVEMADYPLGLDGNGAAGGRVRMLEDRDQNGTYEHSTLFADGLNFPNGILTWRDGVIVTAAPDVIFLRDTDNDGKADVREVLLSGLSEGNQQLRANGLRWGLDNWVYVAAGGHHGKYALETKLLSTRTGIETEIGSRDFRFNPDTGEVEAQSGPTQFGRNRDDWGHWFGTQNARPLWHYVLPDHYLKRNPYLAAPDGQIQLLGEVGPPVYPASDLEKRFHDFKASGRFTSACSGMIYRDSLLFPAEDMNGFACEPFHNVVQRIALEPDGVTFTGTRVGAPDAPDFFASTDRWCRPVMVRTGPDGGLWIADMYRYMIEHPQWLPEEGKAELLPFYRNGDERGRIYRVRPKASPIQSVPDLEPLTTTALVAQLASTNGWVRDKVQQLLLWRGDTDAIAPLEIMAQRSDLPQARLQALCALDGLGNLSESLLATALKDRHPGVRENALRLAESQPAPAVVAAAQTLAKDPDPKVRQQLGFSLGAMPATAETAALLADLLLHDHDDAFITTAALSSALPHQTHLIKELLARNDPALPPLRLTLGDMALSAGDMDSVATLFNPVLRQALRSQADADACAELFDLLARRNITLAELHGTATAGPLAELAAQVSQRAAEALETLHAENMTETQRVAAATILSRLPDSQETAVTYLATQLSPLTPPEIVHHALDILSHTDDERVPGLLVDGWTGFTPPAREQATDVLLSRVPWTQALLDAIPTGTIRPTDLSPIRRTRLLNHPDEKLRVLATERLQTDTNPERTEVIAAYVPALTLEGDLAGGRAKFEELCIGCHRMGDLGFDVGPDLRTVIAHPKEKLLANILDPNLDIQPGYHAYNCELEDGEQLFGLILSENASSITMKLSGGEERSILRSDIFALESTSISMMPEGLEAGLTPQEMANLIAFLKVER